MRNVMPRKMIALLSIVALAAAVSLQATTHKRTVRHSASASRSRDYAHLLATLHTDLGDITMRFYYDKAPNTVKNFVDLASEHFYNGTTFHRIAPGFVIQGGDPYSKNPEKAPGPVGTGFATRHGHPIRLKAEFNDMPHKRGVVSMARSSDPDSASSQFFIVVADSPQIRQALDGKYTAFGEVVSGMDVVDKIVAGPIQPGTQDMAASPVHIKSISLSEQENGSRAAERKDDRE
jgi:peptidyl-prolyl cis-trans isomerase B (cyclophilin B)